MPKHGNSVVVLFEFLQNKRCVNLLDMTDELRKCLKNMHNTKNKHILRFICVSIETNQILFNIELKRTKCRYDFKKFSTIIRSY